MKRWNWMFFWITTIPVYSEHCCPGADKNQEIQPHCTRSAILTPASSQSENWFQNLAACVWITLWPWAQIPLWHARAFWTFEGPQDIWGSFAPYESRPSVDAEVFFDRGEKLWLSPASGGELWRKYQLESRIRKDRGWEDSRKTHGFTHNVRLNVGCFALLSGFNLIWTALICFLSLSHLLSVLFCFLMINLLTAVYLYYSVKHWIAAVYEMCFTNKAASPCLRYPEKLGCCHLMACSLDT